MYTKQRIDLNEDDLWDILDPNGDPLDIFPVDEEEALELLKHLNREVIYAPKKPDQIVGESLGGWYGHLDNRGAP